MMVWKYTEGCKHKLGIFYNINDMANTVLVLGVVIPLSFSNREYQSFQTGDFNKGWFCRMVRFYFRIRNDESVKKGNKRFVWRISWGEVEIGKHKPIGCAS